MSKLGLLPAVSATIIALSLFTVPAINTAAAETGPDLSAGSIDGPQGTRGFNIAWYVSRDRLGYGSHSGVPGHTKVCNLNSQFDWTAPDDPGGSRTIKWVVDENNMVPDSDRSNNTASVVVVINRP